MNYAEYLKLKKDIENEYKRNLEALELIWKRSQSVFVASQQGDNPELPGMPSEQPLSEATRLVISQMNKDFNADEVEQALRDHNYNDGKPINRVSLTNTLHRLFRRGEIELVRKGRGRISSTYKKKGPGDSATT